MCFTLLGSRSSKLWGLPTKLMRYERRALQNCAVSFYSLPRLHGRPPSPRGFVDVCITLFPACEVESLRALFFYSSAELVYCPVSGAILSLCPEAWASIGSLFWSRDAQHKGGSCECSTFILCPKPGPESRQLAALAGCCSRKDTPALVSACADAGSLSHSGCICCGQVLWTFML